MTMPSESSASPMRTIGILACFSMASSNCSGVTTWRITRMSPSFWLRICFCMSIACSTCCEVACCCSTSTSPMRGPISKAV